MLRNIGSGMEPELARGRVQGWIMPRSSTAWASIWPRRAGIEFSRPTQREVGDASQEAML